MRRTSSAALLARRDSCIGATTIPRVSEYIERTSLLRRSRPSTSSQRGGDVPDLEGVKDATEAFHKVK